MKPSAHPRVGVVLAAQPGAEPAAAQLDTQLDTMLRAALDLAGPPEAGRGDRVIVKPNIVCCPGLSKQYGPGAVTDLRIVRSLVAWLVARGCRVTIAEGAGGWRPAPVDGWTTGWGGEFGGLTYTAIAREFGADLLDLNFAETVEYRASGRVYAVPRAIRDCHRLFSLSPLKTNKGAGVSLAMKNFFGIAPGSVYGFPKLGLHALGPLPELIVDLFALRPDAYGIIGGPWAVEGDADCSLRHNVLVAGADCVALDAVGSALMGFAPVELEFLRVARARGLGTIDPGMIDVRGNTIEEARRTFRRSAQWEALTSSTAAPSPAPPSA